MKEEEEEQKRVRVAFITDMGRKEEGRGENGSLASPDPTLDAEGLSHTYLEGCTM